MRNKTIVALLGVFLIVCSFLRADSNPHYYVPHYCLPPNAPAPGQPGYGPANPFTNGVFYNPDTGFWVIPDYLWNPDGSDSDRDIAIRDMIEDLLNQPPPRPAWAIYDEEPDGTYYFIGGDYNGHYYAAGYYFPYEIW